MSRVVPLSHCAATVVLLLAGVACLRGEACGIWGGGAWEGGGSWSPLILCVPPCTLGIGRWSNPQYVEFISVLEDSHRLGTPEVKVGLWNPPGSRGPPLAFLGGGCVCLTLFYPHCPFPAAQTGPVHLRLPQLARRLPLGQRRPTLVRPSPTHPPARNPHGTSLTPPPPMSVCPGGAPGTCPCSVPPPGTEELPGGSWGP